jgi:hypothetical protein
MKQVKIFEKGPKFVFDRCMEAAEWICGDWPEQEGFGSSDRAAVFRSALRDVIGAENAENFFKGNLELNPVEIDLFKTGVYNAIHDVFAREAL